MKKLGLWCGFLLVCLYISMPVLADDIEYSITRYQGTLEIHQDNTETFTETIDYHFDDDFNGQYVTLSLLGNLPDDVTLDKDNIQVSASKNNEVVSVQTEVSEDQNVYLLKVYNGGFSGDDVEISVVWHVSHLLEMNQDVAVLSWVPISDWEVPLHKVFFDVIYPETKKSSLFAHLGYFREVLKVSQSDSNHYQITADTIAANNRLELHAYWDRAIFNSDLINSSSDNAQETFEQVEDNIKTNTKKAEFIFLLLIPSISATLIIIGLITFVMSVRKLTKTMRHLNLGHRLYDIPEELTPLEVSQSIFGLNLELTQPNLKKTKELSFNNMILATLLDLIDRGNITVVSDKDVLVIQHVESLSLYEKELLKLAFGDKQACASNELFSDYYMSKNIFKDKRKAATVRHKGRDFTAFFKKTIHQIVQDVKNALARKHVEDVWRQLTKKERTLLTFSLGFLVASIVVSVGAFLYVADSFQYSLFFYFIFIIIASLLLILLLQNKIYSQGILREDGAMRYYYWRSFQNMLARVNTFDKAELESIVLWNRLLVYATLFGEADKVRKAIKLHQFYLPNSSLNHYVYNPYLSTALYHAVSSYGNSITVAQAASHFQSGGNGSSSGGFSSGGFSGGGGGGGGGAF